MRGPSRLARKTLLKEPQANRVAILNNYRQHVPCGSPASCESARGGASRDILSCSTVAVLPGGADDWMHKKNRVWKVFRARCELTGTESARRRRAALTPGITMNQTREP